MYIHYSQEYFTNTTASMSWTSPQKDRIGESNTSTFIGKVVQLVKLY